MPFTPHHRRSIRLPRYDYSEPGAYFITLVAYQRQPVFGEIIDGEVILTDLGKLINEEWLKSSEIRKEIELDEFVVMPNHFHAIVWVNEILPVITINSCATDEKTSTIRSIAKGPAKRSLGSLIAGFKSACTTRNNIMSKSIDNPIWQRNYYDRIIRNEEELNQIRQYIYENPLRWESDAEYYFPNP